MLRTNIIRFPAATAESPALLPWRGFAFLGVVYVVWGSTFLAMRFAVRGDQGFPPLTLGAHRLALASALLFLWALSRRRSLSLPAGDLVRHAAIGCLLWVGGNGMVTVGVRHVETGHAALIMAAFPIWVALLDAALDRRVPTRGEVRALLLAFSGIAVLSVPALAGGGEATASGVLALLVASMAWAVGTVYLRRSRTSAPPLVGAAYQLGFAAIGSLLVAAALDEPAVVPSGAAWLGMAYLALFGCVVGYGSYVCAVRILPAAWVTTHAYVNPVVAVLLGGLVVGEQITPWTWAGTALVLVGVAEVFRRNR